MIKQNKFGWEKYVSAKTVAKLSPFIEDIQSRQLKYLNPVCIKTQNIIEEISKKGLHLETLH